MRYSSLAEPIVHRTGDLPLACYRVDPAFPRYRMAAHRHRERELIYVRRGRLRLFIDEDELTLSAGDLVLLAPDVIHGGEPEDSLYECIVFDAEALIPASEASREELKALSPGGIVLRADAVAQDRPLFDALYAAASETPIESPLNVTALLLTALCLLKKRLPAAEIREVNSRAWARADRLKPALEYIENNYDRNIKLEDLAALSGFSPKYFCRYFREIVRRSPIDYVNACRIDAAAEMLRETDMNVAEIAARCGYADSSAFIKQFRRSKGVTPYKYRKG